MIASAENNPACSTILTRHFPHTRQLGDVTRITGDQLVTAGFNPAAGIITAGWPCQGNSVAGRRAGLGDPRTGLWRHVVRLLAETRPAWFLGENVPGLYSVRSGRDIAVVREDLAQLGYWWAERILDAQYFGVPQRRRRVFFAGHLGGTGAEPVQVLLEPESSGRHPRTRGAAASHLAGTLGSRHGSAGSTDTDGHGAYVIAKALLRHGPRSDLETENVVAFSENQRGELETAPIAYTLKGTGGKPGQGYPAIASGTMIRRLTPTECERLQGFPDGWTAGQSDSARYRQLGNAVAVPVAEWIIRRIAAAEETSGTTARDHTLTV